ncbi:MAG: hypothetical protein ACYS91_18945, partial [Planctomycetota bacterium]
HDPYSGYEKDVAPFKGLGDEIARRFAEITAMDRSIGTLRDGLEELNVRENTLLWFNSDNGVTMEVCWCLGSSNGPASLPLLV